MAGIRDVASLAEVSLSTVSRVLNNGTGVNETTRDRVLAVAQSLNYRPDTAARNLRRRMTELPDALTYVAGFMINRHAITEGDAFDHEIAFAIEAALANRGFGIRIISADPCGDIPSEIRDQAVDGVIARFDGPLFAKVAEIIPTVGMDIFDDAAGAYCLMPDYGEGAFETTIRLLDSGHRNIAVLAPPPESESHNFWRFFPEGCLRALTERNIPPGRNFYAGAAAAPKDGYEMALRLFADPAHRPDAVMGPDGAMLGLYRAAAEAGLRIPDDLSVIGINNLSSSAYLTPPLTSLDVGLVDLTERAVGLLAEGIASGKKRKGFELTPLNLVQRASARL